LGDVHGGPCVNGVQAAFWVGYLKIIV
jgi:hypothetical protein